MFKVYDSISLAVFIAPAAIAMMDLPEDVLIEECWMAL